MTINEKSAVTIISKEPDRYVKKTVKKYPSFQIIRGWNVGMFFTVDENTEWPIRIGRDNKATFRINHESVSRHHAEIEMIHGSLTIRDNNSLNGTVINGHKIKSAELRVGDKFYIGDILFRFDLMDEADILFSKEIREKALSAQRDPLTHLLSKRYFIEEFPLLFDYYHRRDLQLALLMIDIDFFKKVNDSCGHQAGDHVLAGVAKIILKGIRDFDLAIRYGGEEIMVLLSDTAPSLAGQIAERLRKAVESHVFTAKGRSIPVTISLGLSMLKQDDTIEALFQRADTALYQSKQNGRNRLTIDS